MAQRSLGGGRSVTYRLLPFENTVAHAMGSARAGPGGTDTRETLAIHIRINASPVNAEGTGRRLYCTLHGAKKT